MSTRQEEVKYIADREGFTPAAYWDGDHYSIGYGTFATPEEIKSGQPISQDAGLARLNDEVQRSSDYVDSVIKVPLSDDQHKALVSMAYNVGSFGTGMIDAVNSGDFASVPAHMRQYGAIDPKDQAGVMNRRSVEIATWSGGSAPGSTRTAYAPTAPTTRAPFDAVIKTPAATPLTGVPKPNERPADLSSVASDVFDKNGRIAKGASGDDIREVQHFLNLSGATDAQGRPLAEDGVFGNLTRQAVKDYQGMHPELVQDGIIGPRTMTAMVQDQQQMQKTAGAKFAGDIEGQPQVLESLKTTDPISDAMKTGDGAPGVAGGGLATRSPFSPEAYAATTLGKNIAGYMTDPAGFTDNVAGWTNEDGTPLQPPTAPGVGDAPWMLHPGEGWGKSIAQPVDGGSALTGFDPASFRAFNEITNGRDGATDPLRSGGYSLGDGTSGQIADIVYNTSTAAARLLRDGPPRDESQPDAQPVLFVPPGGGAPEPAPAPTSAPAPSPPGSTDTGSAALAQELVDFPMGIREPQDTINVTDLSTGTTTTLPPSAPSTDASADSNAPAWPSYGDY